MTVASQGVRTEGIRPEISAIIEKYRSKPEMLMRVLLEIQAATPDNFIPKKVATQVSQAVGMPMAQLYEFMSFYSMFSDARQGKRVIRMCKSVPCRVRGASDVAEAFLGELGLSEPGQTTPDGSLTFKYCECLGACDYSPAVIVDDKLYGNLDPAAVKGLVAELLEGAED